MQNNATSTAAAGAQQGTTGDTDGAGDVSSESGSTSATGGQTFAQMLQSFGVSPQQFRQDFLSAVKNAQGGQMNPLTAIQSFPVGSTLDAIG